MRTPVATAICMFAALAVAGPPAGAGTSRYAPLLATSAGQDTLRNLALWEDQRVTGDGALFDYLASPNPLVRLRTVQVIGRLQEPADVPHLLPLLRDPDPRVVHETLFALGQIASEDAMPAILELCEDARPDVVARAAETAGKIGGQAALEFLSDLLRDFNTLVRAEAALALARTEDPAASNALILAVHDPDADVVWRAIYGLEKHENERAAEKALPFLQHDDPLVRSYAARTLGKQKYKPAVPGLTRALGDADLRVAINAARALGEIGEDDAVHDLGRMATEHPSHHVRRAAVEALGAIGDKKGKDYVIRTMMEESVGVRVAAIGALAEILGEDVEMFARQMLDDSSRLVRAAAVRAFGTGGVKKSAELLVTIARTSDDAMIRAAAMHALGEIDAEETGPVLVEGLRDTDWVVATEAALAIGAREYGEAVPALMDAYRTRERREEVSVRIAVLETLTGLAAQDAQGLATDALRDPDRRVRAQAAELLRALGLSADVPPEREINEANFDGTRVGFLMPPSGKGRAVITTAHGEIEVELFGDDATQTVASFKNLAKKGFYDGLTFHRVVPNFVVQGGDPRGDGWGDAGYFIRSEFNRYRYRTGTLGIAHDGKDTGGSQFFITHSPQHHLDGRYTVFGRVTAGIDVLYRIDQGDTFSVRILE